MGDAVLGFVITKMLFDKYQEQEGFLTKARTKLVRGTTLASISKQLGLHDLIYVDSKAQSNKWNCNPKICEVRLVQFVRFAHSLTRAPVGRL